MADVAAGTTSPDHSPALPCGARPGHSADRGGEASPRARRVGGLLAARYTGAMKTGSSRGVLRPARGVVRARALLASGMSGRRAAVVERAAADAPTITIGAAARTCGPAIGIMFETPDGVVGRGRTDIDCDDERFERRYVATPAPPSPIRRLSRHGWEPSRAPGDSPRKADMILDMRFLDDPHNVPALRLIERAPSHGYVAGRLAARLREAGLRTEQPHRDLPRCVPPAPAPSDTPGAVS